MPLVKSISTPGARVRQNRAEVEVGINVSAPWMPTRDALDDYLDTGVVGHNAGDSVVGTKSH